jgi:ABC-type branched-subunit amino acid transport system ATPase component
MTTDVLQDPVDLEVTGVTVRFGGLIAVEDVSLRAEAGKVTGLIGPNGAGKTTTFNACTGLVPTAAGTVRLGHRPLNRLSPSQRAQAGLGRTFQRMALWDTMTVAENVALGRECSFAGRAWQHQLWSRRRERTVVQDAAEAAIERCGITALAGRTTGELSTGQRRLVELARAIASGFRFLLLDEPSSGLDDAETVKFGLVLGSLSAEDGIGILLVEHDITLVRAVCQYCYVLDFGKLICEGPTAEVLASKEVQLAYLGSAALVS